MQEGNDPYISYSSSQAGQLVLSDFIHEDANKILPLAMEHEYSKKESKDTEQMEEGDQISYFKNSSSKGVIPHKA